MLAVFSGKPMKTRRKRAPKPRRKQGDSTSTDLMCYQPVHRWQLSFQPCQLWFSFYVFFSPLWRITNFELIVFSQDEKGHEHWAAGWRQSVRRSRKYWQRVKSENILTFNAFLERLKPAQELEMGAQNPSASLTLTLSLRQGQKTIPKYPKIFNIFNMVKLRAHVGFLLLLQEQR